MRWVLSSIKISTFFLVLCLGVFKPYEARHGQVQINCFLCVPAYVNIVFDSYCLCNAFFCSGLVNGVC